MAGKWLVPIDLAQYELQNAVIQNLAAPPSSPREGQTYYDTVLQQERFWNGSAWVNKGTTGGATSVTAADATLTITPTTGAVTAKVAPASLDHTYVTDFDTQVRTSRLDQMAAPTADVSLNSHKLTNVTDGTSAQDAATYGQVQAAIAGMKPKGTVVAATTAALAANTYANGTLGVGATLTANANGAIAAVDGVSLAVADVILVKDEAAPANNGLYTVTSLGSGGTPYVLTRATNMDVAAEINGAYVLATGGTTNIDQGWIVNSVGPYTMGTTAITFTQWTGVADISAGTGLTKTGNSLAIDTAWPGQAAITTVGTIGTGTWAGTAVAIAHGGTGQTTAAAALAALGGAGKFTATIGDNSSTSIAVTHNLNQDVIAQVRDASTNAVVYCDIVNTSATVTTFTFATAPALNAYKVAILG